MVFELCLPGKFARHPSPPFPRDPHPMTVGKTQSLIIGTEVFVYYASDVAEMLAN